MASSKTQPVTIGSERVVVATSANSEVELSLIGFDKSKEQLMTAGEKYDIHLGLD